MLKKRHLAPTHSLVTYTPLDKEDALLIKDVPDIIATGDLHRPEVSDYNGVLLIASSCWQARTPFEEKVGNNPDPCKVPIMNLKTREVKIIDFSGGEDAN
jgi:DNA polymerase II small subunit